MNVEQTQKHLDEATEARKKTQVSCAESRAHLCHIIRPSGDNDLFNDVPILTISCLFRPKARLTEAQKQLQEVLRNIPTHPKEKEAELNERIE